MALAHAKPGQAIDITPFGSALRDSATHAILKTRALELIRVVLRAGDELPSHSVYGECTLLCIEGAVTVAAETPCELHAGQIVLLPAGQVHGVRAQLDSSLLLTVQTPVGAPGSASSTD